MRKHAWKIAATAVAFFVVTSLTIASTRYSGGLALIWPGSGIVAALLVSLPRSHWAKTLALLGLLSALATSFFGFGPTVAAPLAVVNMFEAWATALLLFWLRPESDWLDSVAGFQRMVIAVASGTLIAAIPGGMIAAWAVSGPWLAHTIDWATGHILGSILSFPLAWLAMSQVRRNGWLIQPERKDFKLAAHLILVGAISSFALFSSVVSLLFLPIAPLMYTAFRCGLRGALLGFVLVMLLSVVSLQSPGTYLYSLNLSEANEAKYLQFYLAILLILALPVSISIKQYNTTVSQLREIRALEQLVAEYSNDALLNLDPIGQVRYCSPAGVAFSGLDEPVGKSFANFFEPIDEPIVRSALERAAENPDETNTLELSVVRGEEVRWLEAKLRAVASENGEKVSGFAVTIRDVTKRKSIELDAKRKSETDELTGLPNRRAFLSELEWRLETAATRPFALALVDLDHFKKINDRYGHMTGDTVLRLLGRLMHKLSQPGIFFARIGGEEFVILADQISAEEMFGLCDELRKKIASLATSGPSGETVCATASIGIAMVNHPIRSNEAMRKADDALYEAKNAGRNAVRMAQDVSEAPDLVPDGHAS